MSEFFWKAIDETEGMDVLVGPGARRRLSPAQDRSRPTSPTGIGDRLRRLLAERLAALDPAKTIVFLTRVAAMAPGLYHMSKLLDEMQGKTRVTTILCLPRLDRGHDRAAVHGPQGPGCPGQLPGQDLRLRHR